MASRQRPARRLSLAAVAHAERLPVTGVEALAPRLYGFGRVPLSGRWTRAYPGPDAVLDLLRPGGLERHWSGSAQPDWLSWRRSGVSGPPPDLPYKLYVSPHVDALTEVLPAAVAALTAAGASHFKVGSDAAGLLRPDKFVVYFRDAGELSAVAGEWPGPGRRPAARCPVLRRAGRRRPAVLGRRPAARRRARRRAARELAAVRVPAAGRAPDRGEGGRAARPEPGPVRPVPSGPGRRAVPAFAPAALPEPGEMVA